MPIVALLYNKFLSFTCPLPILPAEQSFLLYMLQDIYASSHTPIFTSQLGNAVRYLGSSERKVVSDISTINKGLTSEISGTYNKQWLMMKSIAFKLGQAPPERLTKPMETGPTGDAFGISPGLPDTNPDDRSPW